MWTGVLASSLCYPLITNANYTVINAVVSVVIAEGFEMGTRGNQSSVKYLWCGLGIYRAEQPVPTPAMLPGISHFFPL